MIYLPDWLPESTNIKTPTEQFFVDYVVRAQFTTGKPDDFLIDHRYPNKFTDVSYYRGSRSIKIYRANTPHHLFLYEKKMEHTVGLFGAQRSVTLITWKQNTFYPGEKIKISLSNDNTKCDKPVKSFKFKLYR